MDYFSGYMKTEGHIVLEKASVNGSDAFFSVCGDLDAFRTPDTPSPSGRLKGELASCFQSSFLNGIKKYGDDYLQAFVMGYTVAPAGNAPLIGTGCEFGSGCAGIAACGDNAYIYVTEGSGMCIARLTTVFGKKQFVRVLSSSGGEDIIGIPSGSVIIACPETWTKEYFRENGGNGKVLDDVISVFDPGDIASDEAFDRHMRELEGEGFKGCAAALMVK